MDEAGEAAWRAAQAATARLKRAAALLEDGPHPRPGRLPRLRLSASAPFQRRLSSAEACRGLRSSSRLAPEMATSLRCAPTCYQQVSTAADAIIEAVDVAALAQYYGMRQEGADEMEGEAAKAARELQKKRKEERDALRVALLAKAFALSAVPPAEGAEGAAATAAEAEETEETEETEEAAGEAEGEAEASGTGAVASPFVAAVRAMRAWVEDGKALSEEADNDALNTIPKPDPGPKPKP